MMTRLFLLMILVLNFSVAYSAETKKNQSPVPKISQNKSRFEQLELFNKVLHLIETQYYREVSTEKLIEGALKGMMETLDPHSTFLNRDFFEKMQNDTQGEFGGLGLEVTQKDNVIYIVTPIDDTPAFRAGIKPKDKLVEINNEPIVGMSMDEAMERMRGKVGEKIQLGVLREGLEGVKSFTLVRELIKIKPVKSEMIQDRFAFSFNPISASSTEVAERFWNWIRRI